ncbi:hypothetical protein [Streptomyces sp. NPDC094049]|uniref:hypothetical protein n=1 Tax=Streptomyces sp. NPDC094049 TaxID=3154987 RepID=UPI00332597DD
MTDPAVPGLPGLEGGEEQAAEDVIQEVVNWYTGQLLAEHRAPAADEGRVGELKAARQAALADQQQLATADPLETARIAGFYAARLKELNAP